MLKTAGADTTVDCFYLFHPAHFTIVYLLTGHIWYTLSCVQQIEKRHSKQFRVERQVRSRKDEGEEVRLSFSECFVGPYVPAWCGGKTKVHPRWLTDHCRCARTEFHDTEAIVVARPLPLIGPPYTEDKITGL